MPADYHYDPGPIYRIAAGRPPLDGREVRTKLRNFTCPEDLWDQVRTHCEDPEVARVLSGREGGPRAPAGGGDYIRAALLLTNLLMAHPANRARILSLLLLPDYRLSEVAGQLAFKFAALPNPNPRRGIVNPEIILDEDPPGTVDSNLHAEIYRQNEGLETVPGEAAMTDPHPWQPNL